jgi:hypothetical protein
MLHRGERPAAVFIFPSSPLVLYGFDATFLTPVRCGLAPGFRTKKNQLPEELAKVGGC